MIGQNYGATDRRMQDMDKERRLDRQIRDAKQSYDYHTDKGNDCAKDYKAELERLLMVRGGE